MICPCEEGSGQLGTTPVNRFKSKALRLGAGVAAFASAALASGLASAQEDWQFGFQDAASPVMREIAGFNNALMVVMAVISVFVTVLLAWVMIRYRAKANPVPTKTTHNTGLEVAWTVVPVMILVGIAVPSFSLLFAQYDPGRLIEDYDSSTALNVKATGLQWSWQYSYLDPEYPIGGSFPFYTSLPVGDVATLNFDEAEPRLLEATLPLVVPVDRVVRLQVTADPTGVLHAFALPAMGVKVDAVPGRITESWFLAEREGTYYGQCSELCGRLHYAMPIELRVVSAEEFEEWAAIAATDDYVGAKELLDSWETARLAEQVAGR